MIIFSNSYMLFLIYLCLSPYEQTDNFFLLLILHSFLSFLFLSIIYAHMCIPANIYMYIFHLQYFFLCLVMIKNIIF